MIKGSVKLYEEPAYNTSLWDDYDDFHEPYSTFSNGYREREKAYEVLLDATAKRGYVEGARVACLLTGSRIGTITHIHKHHSAAYNYSSSSFEPFQVTWDNASSQFQSCYYSPGEIKILKEEPTPSVPKKRLS